MGHYGAELGWKNIDELNRWKKDRNISKETILRIQAYYFGGGGGGGISGG